MDATTLAERIEGAVRVNRVFGEPVTVDGVTVIPVARVGAGGGGGSGRDIAPTGPTGAATDRPDDPASAGRSHGQGARRAGEGAGGGLGWTGQPCGVFVLHDGQVSWQPALDVNRLISAAAAVSIAALITARAVIRARTTA